ncbi:ISKra4 family transposase [uncultured Thiocystis sp.]|uniref:ISKra4 family transposase n=1 Tax=uncultured Thiocystis sp. TaxID=1202134 RepID=UPI0025FEB85F|nr:ISKra4 family transposase [uncultured Thiocystis sp.]
MDCPLEQQARIIRDASPRFASQLRHKYGQLNARAVQTDLEPNHGRQVATSYIQNVAEWVGGIAGAKEALWESERPALDAAIRTLVLSLDGARIPMADSAGDREARVGALSLYDSQGERQHTVSLAAAPAYGKAEFKPRMERAIVRLKRPFPAALSLGIADGAATNWAFLEQHTERQLSDFYHATEDVAKIARAAHPQAKAQREQWQTEHGARLKHQPDAVATRIEEATQLAERRTLSQQVRDDLDSARTDCSNHCHQMDDARDVADGLPIGSGVTEAACKTLVKQRLCASGRRWKNTGAKIVLSLRALTPTPGRWTQFWQRIDQFGAECCC